MTENLTIKRDGFSEQNMEDAKYLWAEFKQNQIQRRQKS